MRKFDEDPSSFDVNSLGLTFNEVLSFADHCQGTVSELGLLLTGTRSDPQQLAKRHEKHGKAMWGTLGLSRRPPFARATYRGVGRADALDPKRPSQIA